MVAYLGSRHCLQKPIDVVAPLALGRFQRFLGVKPARFGYFDSCFKLGMAFQERIQLIAKRTVGLLVGQGLGDRRTLAG